MDTTTILGIIIVLFILIFDKIHKYLHPNDDDDYPIIFSPPEKETSKSDLPPIKTPEDLYNYIMDITPNKKTSSAPPEKPYTPSKSFSWPNTLVKNKINYNQYITSKEWYNNPARLAVIQRDKVCKMCGSNNFLQVHHITYTNLGNEKEEDLVLLCENCHKKVHKVAGKNAGYYPIL